jgi:outer membrane protein assembly factor BamB
MNWPSLYLFTCACTLAPTLAAAEPSSWPTWRGPSGAGLAPDAKPPTTWSDQQNIRWKSAIPGTGFSTPIIWKDQIFLLTAIETSETRSGGAAAEAAPPSPPRGGDPKGKGGKKGGGFGGGGMKPSKVHDFAVVALDRKTGNILWQKSARREVPHEGRHPTNSFASYSPVTDGERLYASFGSHGLFCYTLQGVLLWEKDLGDMQTRNGFGEGASPALAGDLIIIPWDQEQGSFVVALDKRTGAEIWRKSRNERSGWSTPLVVQAAGKSQVILPASNRTRSYDALNGDVIWEASGLTTNVIPAPVTGHGMVYVMSGFQGYSIQAIKLSSLGDVSETNHIAWNVRKSAPYVASAVLSGERLYVSKSTDAYLSCLNALTGEFYFQDQVLTGLRGLYASPIAANGYLYVVGREGTVMVLRDAEKFEIVATNQLKDKIDASPVAVDRELFLRGHDFLYCIAEG